MISLLHNTQVPSSFKSVYRAFSPGQQHAVAPRAVDLREQTGEHDVVLSLKGRWNNAVAHTGNFIANIGTTVRQKAAAAEQQAKQNVDAAARSSSSSKGDGPVQ
jgi:hypothetical protein